MEPFARPLIAGNWKMNGLSGPAMLELDRLCERVAAMGGGPDIAICPPATLLAAVTARVAAKGLAGRIATGGQDCHQNPGGAHTGDVAAAMLKDAGATYCIIGHSERRADHGETDASVAAKAKAAIDAGLIAIVCVGETLAQRDAGATLEVVRRQLAGSIPQAGNAATMVVAYEPVWAIGTGRTPTLQDVEAVHGALRARLSSRAAAGVPVRLLYGGSVKPDNARELMAVAHVDGALVGGASLKAADFWPIIEAKR